MCYEITEWSSCEQVTCFLAAARICEFLLLFGSDFGLQPQLISSCRNFLKYKQRDDISVAGENIISNKQRRKVQLHQTDIAVAFMKLLICQIFPICG